MTRSAIRLTILLIIAVVLTACGASLDPAVTTTTEAETSTTAVVTTSMDTTTTSDPTKSSTAGSETVAGDLLVVGDWGSGTAPQGAVAGAMQRYSEDHDVTAILTTGDNFYSDDAEFLMAPYYWVDEAGLEWWITWGNHDVETEPRIDAVTATFDNPPRWAVYPWGDVDVIVLDSNQITSAQQAAFFLAAMAANDRPTIVAMHHPPYSCTHQEGTIDLVNQVVEVLDDDVVLVLSGHDHSFQRFESDGVSYVVSGGGGSQLYPIQECPPNHPPLIAGEELHHFLSLVRDESGDIVVSAIDVNGAVFDEFVVGLG